MAIEKDFSLPELGDRIEELVEGRGPLWDIVYTRVTAALDHLEEQVAVRTPVGVSGNLRAGWGTIPPKLRGEGVIVGELVNPISYGPDVEYGKKPGPFEITSGFKLWVKRKLEVPDKDVEAVSFAIAKSIEKNGTRAQNMLRDGWDAALPAIDAQMSAMLIDIVTELGDSIAK